MKLQTNSLHLTEPIIQTITGKSLATKELSSTPFPVTQESYFKESAMKNIGNVTNNMTFTNSYLSGGLFQGKGNGTIETKEGRKEGRKECQTINWISLDIGKISSKGPLFLWNN